MSEYATAHARRAQINAKMDEQFTKIRSQHADELKQLDDTCEEKMNALHLYAEARKDEFEKKRSMEFVHGVIGFRMGTPKLKPSKGFTWAACLELLKMKAPQYVRTIEEPAKDRLLADRENAETALLFGVRGVGCEVAQDETFFVDLKKEVVAGA